MDPVGEGGRTVVVGGHETLVMGAETTSNPALESAWES